MMDAQEWADKWRDGLEMSLGPEEEERIQLLERAASAAEEMGQWLVANRGAYARAREEYRDVAWLQDALTQCEQVLRVIESHDPKTDPPSHAVFLIGQAIVSLTSVFQTVELVRTYEAHIETAEHLEETIREETGNA